VSEQSAISWTDATWNPVTGCTKVSPGCAHCYIERTPPFRMAGRRFVKGAIPVLLHPDRLEQPLRWKKPRRVFVCSLADLFHEDVPDAFIGSIFGVMAAAREHTFQVLTKRLEAARWLFSDADFLDNVEEQLAARSHAAFEWPLPNVHLGVSVENQRMADERIPVLLDTPAAVRFLSCEPLLSGLDLTPWLVPLPEMESETCQRCNETGEEVICCDDLCANNDECIHGDGYAPCSECGGVGQIMQNERPAIDWVICGGESGPGSAERKLVERCPGPGWHWKGGPTPAGQAIYCKECGGTGWCPKPRALEWVRSIRDQCVAAGVAYHFKQLGGPRPTSGGRLLDGRTWDEMP